MNFIVTIRDAIDNSSADHVVGFYPTREEAVHAMRAKASEIAWKNRLSSNYQKEYKKALELMSIGKTTRVKPDVF